MTDISSPTKKVKPKHRTLHLKPQNPQIFSREHPVYCRIDKEGDLYRVVVIATTNRCGCHNDPEKAQKEASRLNRAFADGWKAALSSKGGK